MSDFTPPIIARAFCGYLFGDPDFQVQRGVSAARYFLALPEEVAFREYRQIKQLKSHDRGRDLLERMEMEGMKV